MKHFYALLVLLLIGNFGFGQITENFDTGLAPAYTTGNQTLTSGTWATVEVFPEAATESRGGTGSAVRFQDDVASASITTPALSGAGIVTFWHRELNSGGGVFSLQTSTDGTTYTTQTTQAYSGNTYTQFTYTLNDFSANLTIRILSDNSNGHLIVDDFDVTAYSNPCVAVTGITIDSNTDTTAVVSWTAGASETTWEIAVQPAGTGVAIPPVASTGTTNNPHTTSVLTAQTDYEVYVRADCTSSSDGYSSWVGPIFFTTDCATFTAPYTEDFENAGAVPDCWTLAGDEDWKFSNSASGNHIGNNGTLTGSTASDGYFAWLDDSTPNATNAELRSPLVDLTPLTRPGLSFYEISNNEGNTNSTLTVEVWDGAAWNLVGTYNTNTDGWEEKIIDLAGLTFTGPAQARFLIAESADFYDDIAIDDVSFYDLPACPDVTNLTTSSISDVSATIGWTAGVGNTVTAWEVAVQADGTGTPTGAGASATANPYNATGLTASTDYEVFVRSNCTGASNGFGSWVGPIDFTTTAAPITVFPYNENFELGAAGWSIDNTTNGSWQLGIPINTIINTADSGAFAWVTNLTGNYNDSETSYVISPPLNFSTLVAPIFEFSVWWNSASGDGMVLQSSIDNGSTWQNVGANGDPNNWYNTTSGWSGTGTGWVVAKHDLTGLGGQTSVFLRVEFNSGSSINDEGLAFDTVHIFQEACPDVSAITIDSFNDTDAQISWTAGNTETNWEYVVQIDGTGVPTTGTASTTNPQAVTGLTAETAYEVYVRANCLTNGFSGWIGPVDFTTQAACPDLSDLTIDSFTATTADISWTVNGTEAAWEIVVQADGLGEPTAAGTATTTNPHTESGLTAQTAYEVYVRADCTSDSDGYSNWIGPVDFTTNCAIYVPDYTEDFATFLNPCWLEAQGGDLATGPATTGSAGYGSEEFAHTSSSGGGAVNINLYLSGGQDWLLSPYFDLSAGGYELVVDVAMTDFNATSQTDGFSTNDEVQLVYSTDGTSWTALVTWNLANTPAAAGETETVDISTLTGTNIQFAIRTVEDASASGRDIDFHIDNFKVRTPPSCNELTGLTLDSVTDSTAIISWTAVNGETDWEIVVQADGTGVPTGSGTATTTNPHTDSSLTAQTDYEVYVRANCLTNGFSAWVGPLAFSTACPAISTFPYTEDLETTSTTLSCWSVNNNNADGDTWTVQTSATYANSGTQSYQMYTDFNGGANDDYLISPKLTLTGNERLKFNERVRSSGEPDELTVLLSTTGTAPADFTTTILANASYSNTTYQEIIIDLSAYTGDVYIAFHVPPSTTDGWYLYIDDITVEAIPACLDVTNIATSSISDIDATITWTAGDSETDWEIVVQTAGTGAPTGAGTAITTTASHTESGLTTQTDYEVYVRANCLTNGFSNWVGPYNFTTACTAVTNFAENFDSVTTPDLPVCWSSILDNGTNAGAYVRTSTSADNSLPNGVQMYNAGTATTTQNIMLVSPNLSNLGDGTHLLRFSARNTTSTQEIEVGTVSSPTDGSTFTALTTVDLNTTFTEYEVSFAGYSGTDDYIAIRRIATSTFTSVYLDDIVWEALPACPDVTSLNVDSLTDTTANISWTAGLSETNWEIVVQADGTGLPTGAGTATTTNNPYVASPLTSETAYEVYVRADCTLASNGYSDWVGPVTFTTPCSAIVPSYTANMATNVPDSCWEEAGSGEVAAGPGSIGASSWTTGSYAIGSSNKVNLYQGNTAREWLLSPTFDLSTGGPFQLEVNTAVTDYNSSTADDTMGSDDEVQLLSTIDGGTTWVNITTWNAANEPLHTGTEYIADLTAYTGNVQFAIWASDGATDDTEDYDFHIGQFIVRTPPTCFDLTGLTIDSFTGAEATISWTAVNAETDWEIVVQADGTGIPTGAGTATTSNPHTESGLTAQTAYEVYVRANCLTNGFSGWVGPVDFTTECQIYTPDYTEDFATFLNPCWTEAADGALNSGPATFGSANWTAEEFAHTSSSGGGAVNINIYTTGDIEWLMSPKFDLSAGGYEVLIDVALTNYNSTTAGAFNAGDEVRLVYSLDGTSWTTLQLWDQANTPSNTGQTVTTDISTITGTEVQFALYVIEGTTGRDIDFHADNFKVRTPPSCLDISNLAITSFTATDVIVGWTAGDTETAWEIAVQADGTGIPAAAGTATTNNPHTETGLTGQTAYEVYVRADCGGTLGNWVGPVDFTTPCAAIVPEYTADMSVNVPDACWEEAGSGEVAAGPGGLGASSWDDGNTYALGASNAVNIYGTSPREWLLSPTFDLSTGGPFQLEVNVAVSNWNDGFTADTMGSDDEVQLLSSIDGGTTWVNITTWNAANEPALAGTEYIADLTAYTGDTQFAIWASSGTTSGQDYDFHVGKFKVKAIPSCPEPTAFTVDTFDRTSATISWTEGGAATAWEIVVQPDGTGVPTGAGTATSSNPHTEIGLTAATAYEVYVRANCGPGDLSVWVGPLTFTTANPLPTTTTTLNVSACGPAGADTYNAPYDASTQNVVWAELNYTAGCPSLTIDTIGSDFDTEIGIYDANGTLVASNDSGGTGITPQSLFTEVGLATGTYYIAAGMFNVTFGPDFAVTSSNATQTGTLFINVEGQSNDVVDFCNLQFPNSGTITEGGNWDVYAQVFHAGVTDAAGQGAGIQSWIGYSTTDATTTADFVSGWTWVAATYSSDQGNNDEYIAEIGSTLTPGIYYYASRFTVNGGGFSYGGINPGSSGGNFWDGTTAVSGQLTVNSASIPTTVATFNINGCGDTATYNGAYASATDGVVWVELIYDGNCTEITVDTESSTGIDTEIGLYDMFGNFIASNDDGGTGSLSLLTEVGLAAGTYYIVAGAYNTSFNANFDATTTDTADTGTLYINASTPNFIDFCNLQSPNSGTIVAGGTHDVYAQVYEPGRTEAAGQGANILSWIGYSATDATTIADFASGWTWVAATYNTDSGNNDEYQASIGSSLAVGTYYYVSRFSVDGGDFAYGGINPGSTDGNFWDGTNYVSGQLTVNPTPEPTNHVLAFTAVADSDSQITLTWNDNDGAQPADGFVIVGKTGAGVFTTIVDGTDPANDVDWSDDEFEFKRASGLQSYTVVGLDASTLYEFEIYPYTNTGSLIDFKTDGTIPSTSATTAADPCLVAINTFPYDEGFEAGILPNCWSQEFVNGTVNWTYNNGAQGGSVTSPHTGSFNALFYDTTSSAVNKLVSPKLDITGISTPTLSFWHAQEVWGSDQDELRVYYKTSEAGAWTLLPLQTYTSSISTWTKETIELPNASADYYIAFEATGGYGRGVVLDDVKVEEIIAVTYTYDGTNWAPSDPIGVSTVNDDMIITSGDAPISANTSIKTVTVNPGAAITVNSGITLSVENDLTLESVSNSYSSLINDGTITGTIKYERYVNSYAGGNDLITAPLSGETWSSFLASDTNAADLLDNGLTSPTTYAFAPYDKSADAYVNYTDATSTTLVSGIGYRAATDSGTTLTFTGTVPTSEVPVNLEYTGTEHPDWNLLGNPYPSYLNLINLWYYEVQTGSGVFNYDLMATGTGIYGYDGDAANGWKVITEANIFGENPMTPGQGFLIAADPTQLAYDFKFGLEMRTVNSTDDFIAGRDADVLTYFKLSTNTTENDFTTQFYFNENATQGLDHRFDGKLLGNFAPSFALYSQLVEGDTDARLALQALNPSDLMDVVIPLGVNANSGEQLTFTISETTLPSTVEVYLDDTLNNTSTLLNTSDYVITPNANIIGTGRFFLRVSNSALSVGDVNLNSVKIYTKTSPRSIFIEGIINDDTTAKVYDIQGRLVYSTDLESNNLVNEIDASDLQSGVYVVTLTDGTKQKSQKVILR